MRHILMIVAVSFLFSTCAWANKKSTYDFQQAWAEVDSLRADRLPLSIAEKANEIYDAAVEQNQAPQQVKALIYWIGAYVYKDDDDVQKIVDNIQDRIDSSEGVAKPLLHAIMAQTLAQYLNKNLWRFSQRGELIQENQDDISTWDIPSLIREISRHYELALEPEEILFAQNVDEFEALFKSYTPIPGNTLYDYLAMLALTFYSKEQVSVSIPWDGYDPCQEQNFYPVEDFVGLTPPEPRGASLHYKALKLFQNVLRLHAADADAVVRVRWDLLRLEYFYKKSPWQSGYILYEAALNALAEDNVTLAGAWVARDLFLLNYELGTKYNPEVSEDFRWRFESAKKYYRQAMVYLDGNRTGLYTHGWSILQGQVDVGGERYFLPDTPALLYVKARNTKEFYLKVFNTDHPEKHSPELNLPPGKYDYRNYFSKTEPLLQVSYDLPAQSDCRDHIYEAFLPPLAPGGYKIVVDESGFDSWRKEPDWGLADITVTDIGYIKDKQHPTRLYLKSRSTGEALAGIEVRTYWEKKEEDGRKSYVQFSQSKSDKYGIIDFTVEGLKKDYSWITLSKGKDKVFVRGSSFRDDIYPPGSRWPENQKDGSKNIQLLFSDRAIYRPGQSIHIKGLSAERGVNGEAIPNVNRRETISLSDYRNREFAHKDLITNEYGTFHWTFMIPEDVRPGKVRISTSIGWLIVQVEEYKRPRFEVKLQQPEHGYKLNSELTIQGSAKAYAGFPIEHAELNYRIYREARYPYWRWWWGTKPEHAAEELITGMAKTDKEGNFSIKFEAKGDVSALSKYQPFFVYTIQVDVTDQGGESRSASLSLNIGKRELILDAEIAEYLEQGKKELYIPITAMNLSSEKLHVSGSISLKRLKTPEHIMRRRFWPAPESSLIEEEEFRRLFPHDAYLNEDDKSQWEELETAFSGSFDTLETDLVEISGFNKLKAGCYKLTLKGEYKGQESSLERFIEIVSPKAAKPAYPQAFYLAPLKVEVQPSEMAKVLIGSSYQNFHLRYEIERHKEIIHSEAIVLNNEQRILEIPITEQDRGNIYLTITGVKDCRFYSVTQEITVPWSNKELELEVLTKRDHLQPGAEEEWQIRVRDYLGKPVSAEILASMYDASLDAFKKSSWSRDLHQSVARENTWRSISIDPLWSYEHGNTMYRNKYYDVSRKYNFLFNWYKFRLFDASQWARQDQMYSSDLSSMSDRGGSSPKLLDPEAIPIRSNFAETAFFYPELKTDKEGDSYFAFKVPDSLTRWKFRALALTQDLKIGYTEFELPSQKALMLTPNLPRFLREGDDFIFTVKINSRQDTDLQGDCQLMLLNAESGAALDQDFALADPVQSFSLKGTASTVLQWRIRIPAGLFMVKYRVLASAGSFSDAEEGLLPILSNRMLLTESLPLPMRGKSKRNFRLDKLLQSGDSKTLSQHSLTLEFTANPLWYAVQSLPYLMEYPYNCSEQIFSRYYANALARHILQTNPQILATIASWQSRPDTPTLQSNLQKNPELKSIALQETPWIFSAKSENARRKNLANHLNAQKMETGQAHEIAELLKAQSPSGGWPWFPGMSDSRYMTQYIVSGFAQMEKLGIDHSQNKDLASVLFKAIRYLDDEYLKDYRYIESKGRLKDYGLSPLCAHYLYTRSFYMDIPMEEETQPVHEFYMTKATQQWNKASLHIQGLIALAMHRSGDAQTANKIVASLSERALRDDELGMWWNEPLSWHWYQAPIETQSQMIEVFSEITQDIATVDELRLWLLKHKQTNSWRTTTATAKACYALLLSGSDWLSDIEPVTITLGTQKLDSSQSEEEGVGYFKQVWAAEDILPQMGKVKVDNPNPVPAWGALYWQYFEDLDKITPAQSPLSLKKELYLQKSSPSGPVLETIKDGASLKTGDKIIVRIVLRSDRDMEFVHMKDMRGSGLEPVNVFSESKRQDGLVYYEVSKDAATHFFFDYLPTGTYVFEYPLWVNNQGDFSNGICSIQSMYAPEFAAHSEGIRIKVSE